MKTNFAISVLVLASLTGTAGAVTSAGNQSEATGDNAVNQLVVKGYVSNIVATYACRSTLDGGNGEYHKALSDAENAFTRVFDDRDRAKKMVDVLSTRIENDDPGAQLLRQFDEVNAGKATRKQSCEQLIRGAKNRIAEADKAYATSKR